MCDLQLRRGERDQRRGVALAGGLSGGTKLLVGPCGQGLGVQVLKGLDGLAQVLPGVDPPLAAAQPLSVGELGPRRVERPSGARMVRQGLLEEARRPGPGPLSARGRRRRWRAPTACRWRRRNVPARRSSHERPPCPRRGPPLRCAPAADIRARTGNRNLVRWCSAPTLSPEPAARSPLAQRVRSWTGSVRIPRG